MKIFFSDRPFDWWSSFTSTIFNIYQSSEWTNTQRRTSLLIKTSSISITLGAIMMMGWNSTPTVFASPTLTTHRQSENKSIIRSRLPNDLWIPIVGWVKCEVKRERKWKGNRSFSANHHPMPNGWVVKVNTKIPFFLLSLPNEFHSTRGQRN